jgi:uncharacterized membrane protein
MPSSPYVVLTMHVLAFGFWSSFWPRRAIKRLLEPRVGFRVYRIFYNIGTIGLFCMSFGYMVQHSAETRILWNLHGYVWFRPLIYAINCLGVFFLAATRHLGLSFWGLKNPPPDGGLQTTGFYKITRHPLYWSVFCLLFAHMLVFGSGLAVLYFFWMELYNVVGVIVFENRGLARHYGPALTEFHARTSTLPFLAIVQGRVKLKPGELPRSVWLGALLFTVVVGVLHAPILERLMYTIPTLAFLR